MRRDLSLNSSRLYQRCLLVWLDGAERAPLRRAFAAWIRAVLLPTRMPLAEITEVQHLQEVQSMLAERV